jgi:small subunit ribosomal protein S2
VLDGLQAEMVAQGVDVGAQDAPAAEPVPEGEPAAAAGNGAAPAEAAPGETAEKPARKVAKKPAAKKKREKAAS